MTQKELAKVLARALLLKEGHGSLKSFKSLICIRSYFEAMSMEELLGIATQNGLNEFL